MSTESTLLLFDKQIYLFFVIIQTETDTEIISFTLYVKDNYAIILSLIQESD